MRTGQLRAAISMAIMSCAAHSALAADIEGVTMTGYNVQFGNAAVSESALSRSQLCGADGEASLMKQINTIAERLEESLAMGGIPASDRLEEARSARSELCEGSEAFSVDAYAMTYADCRMAMDTASMLTDITLPPGSGPVTMTMSDFYRAESSTLTLDRDLAATPVANTEMTDVSWTGPGDSKQIAGFPAARWGFEYQGSVGAGIGATFSTSGHGYWSQQAPGSALVSGFFDRFNREVKTVRSSASMVDGMLNTMVDMLQKGLPLEMEQTITTSVAGMRQKPMRSRMKATGVRTVRLQGDYCTRSLVPDYFETNDLNETLRSAGMMSGSQSGAGQTGVPEMDSVMGELSRAMEGMTPEQREAMQGMGLGSLFGGETAAQSPPAAPAQTASASRSRTSASSELRTDNLTQSVQLHLQALGYDPGNTDGELSTNSIIAISQFQAENGLQVTGEVTPQLLGILAARVDAR